MKTIEVKRQLLEEALDQLKGAQQDCYVLSTQNVIDELEVVLSQPAVSGSLLVEIKTLLEQYRDEEMPDWNAPFHYDAEGWAAMKYFIQWLERKGNDR